MAVLYSKNDQVKNNVTNENLKLFCTDKKFAEVTVCEQNFQIVVKDEKITKEENSKRFRKKYAGVFLALSAGIMFSLVSLLVKFMKGYHPFTLAAYKFQGLLLISLPLMAFEKFVQKKNIFQFVCPLGEKGNFKTFIFLCIRGAIGCCALVLHFYSLQYLTVADTTIIGTCRPVFVILLAFLTLQEKCGIFPVFVAVLTILGVGVILRPPMFTNADAFDENILIGSGFAFCAMLGSAFAYTVVRRLRKVHFSVVTSAFGIWGAVTSLVVSTSLGVFKLPDNRQDWVFAFLLALFAFLVQSFMTLALKFDQAGPVSLVRTSDPVFAFMWQFAVLGVTPDIFSLIGAIIVMSGVVLIVLSKSLSHLPDDHPTRKRFAFILK